MNHRRPLAAVVIACLLSPVETVLLVLALGALTRELARVLS